MRARTVMFIAILLGVISGPTLAAAADERYILPLAPTQNWPGASGQLELKIDGSGQTHVKLRVRNAAPNMLYTLWTVYNELVWPLPTQGEGVPSRPARNRVDAVYGAFPPQGNGVSPVASLSSKFTGGMGLDPGITFYTDKNGNGDFDIKLDYDLVHAAPVSSKDVIAQPVCTTGWTSTGSCSTTPVSVLITSTWLRQFIADFPLDQRAAMCANYDPAGDPQANPAWVPGGENALLWQCMDPDTANGQGRNGLSRVYRYVFDHFRLAGHVDDFTHGFIGGNGTDHRIDMVGRRQDMLPVR
jgi:hypothetical protein